MANRETSSAPSIGLVLVRLVTGAILVFHGWRWLQGPGIDPEQVRLAVQRSLDGLPGLLAGWGEHVLLSNPDAIAFLWTWAAFLCGCLLFLGALTRPAGWVAVLFLLHGYAYGPEPDRLLFLVLLVSCLACALSRAGRRIGLDVAFDEHFPGWLTWTRRPGSFFS